MKTRNARSLAIHLASKGFPTERDIDDGTLLIFEPDHHSDGSVVLRQDFDGSARVYVSVSRSAYWTVMVDADGLFHYGPVRDDLEELLADVRAVMSPAGR